MTRADFMARLKQGLTGMPASAAADIINDYHAHFEDGAAAGRSEAEVASALGDPDRLARELRAEAGFQRWRQEQNPSAAAGAIFAFAGLGALDILILLPILISVVSMIVAFYIVGVAGLIAGGAVMIAGPFAGGPGGPIAAFLLGLGVIAVAVCGLALLTIVSIWLVNGLIWFARLHYRVLKPALEPQTVAA